MRIVVAESDVLGRREHGCAIAPSLSQVATALNHTLRGNGAATSTTVESCESLSATMTGGFSGRANSRSTDRTTSCTRLRASTIPDMRAFVTFIKGMKMK
jgi:hypothetical protein